MSRTIVFMPESAYGPTNNCIGIGAVLLERGHRVVFAAEASWKGRLAPLGFEEQLVDLSPPPDASDDAAQQDAGAFWKDFIRETSPEFRKPTIEQLATFVQPTFQALIDGARYCQPQLERILADVRPDVTVLDNVVNFPALMTAGAPFVRIMSCNPLELKGPGVAPTFSGLARDDVEGWRAFRAEYERTHRATWTAYDAWVQDQGAPGLDHLDFVHVSPDLNLYVYPEAMDYTDARPLDATWQRLDSSVRTTDEAFDLPQTLRDRPDGSALVYLSLGSLGSADVDLMRRLVEVLGGTLHRYIVSTGPQHAEYQLADNMWGQEFLPQTIDPPGRRPGHHARREQHDHRGPALRQADDRAAALLGPVRQRAAGARDRSRHPARHLPLHRRGHDRGAGHSPRRRGAAPTAGGGVRHDPRARRRTPGGRPDRAGRRVSGALAES